jgi:hypothetical protein
MFSTLILGTEVPATFVYNNTVELGYNIGYCDTSPIASNTQWYELIPHKATVFIPRLVRHSQMHQPRI